MNQKAKKFDEFDFLSILIGISRLSFFWGNNGRLMEFAFSTIAATDYGRPIKPFFIEIINFLAWADNLGR